MASYGSQVPADYIVQFTRVISSSVATAPDTGENLGILFHVEGIGEVDTSGTEPALDLGDDAGESDSDAEVFGALGVLSRPLPPDTEGGQDRHAEVVCLRLADGLIPIAARDLRVRMGGVAPNPGTVALVGYGGGFISEAPVDPDNLALGTIQTMYCPYDLDSDGVPQKAHAIMLDPTADNESVSIVHAEGMAITMYGPQKELVIKNSDGSAAIVLNDSGITLTGQINLSGGVVIGNPSLAIPMLAGVASPPCSTLFLSP